LRITPHNLALPFRRKIMIEVKIYCRKLFHFGLPRTVVKVQLEGWAEALLRKHEQILQEPSCVKPAESSASILTKVENLLKNASKSSV
jgi:hypothetical protein